MPVVRISDELFSEIQKYAEPLVDTFDDALWKALKANTGTERKPAIRQATTTPGHFPPRGFWKPILQILVDKGGNAPIEDVIKELEKRLKAQLLPGDWESNADGTYKWDKQANFQRLAMVHKGLLANNSPRGIWGITDQGRQWLKEH